MLILRTYTHLKQDEPFVYLESTPRYTKDAKICLDNDSCSNISSIVLAKQLLRSCKLKFVCYQQNADIIYSVHAIIDVGYQRP